MASKSATALPARAVWAATRAWALPDWGWSASSLYGTLSSCDGCERKGCIRPAGAGDGGGWGWLAAGASGWLAAGASGWLAAGASGWLAAGASGWLAGTRVSSPSARVWSAGACPSSDAIVVASEQATEAWDSSAPLEDDGAGTPLSLLERGDCQRKTGGNGWFVGTE